jgi:hypothetical protein
MHKKVESHAGSATQTQAAAATISKPGAVLEVRAVVIPPRIQATIAAAIRGASGKSGQ